MGANSRIEWTDATWNPIRARRKDTGKTGWHCERVSPACQHCYAATFNRRNLPTSGTGLDYDRAARDQVEIYLDPDVLTLPLRWKRPRKIFVCSMTDLFGEFVPGKMIGEVFRVMYATPQHTYQILTKRPERMNGLMKVAPGLAGFPNVWLGVTAEDQRRADERIPKLLDTPAAVRFVSVEPMLGPIRFRWNLLDWVIAGGESGALARPSHPDWFRSLRDQRQAAGMPFFFKQWGAWKPVSSASYAAPAGLEDGINRVAMLNDGRICFQDQGPEKPLALVDAAAAADWNEWQRSLDELHRSSPAGDCQCKETHVDPFGYEWMARVGKQKAGHLLDGREWREFPS